jgi:hypothetical protein
MKQQAEFARATAYLASYCAKWAGDAADMAQMELDDPFHHATVLRFANEVRARLRSIERAAMEPVPTGEQTAPKPATPDENISAPKPKAIPTASP